MTESRRESVTNSGNEQIAASGRRCAWCGARDQGWSEVHLLISETGDAFCSCICVERMESDCNTDIVIVAESGMQSEHPFGDVAALERR